MNSPSKKNYDLQEIENMACASEMIAFGDNIYNSIRTNNEWTLMTNLAFCSTIYPSQLCSHSLAFPKFSE